MFNYYDAKELAHLRPPNFSELGRAAKEGLRILEEGIEGGLRVRRGGHRGGVVYVAGHAHIDLGWLWSRDVTREKVRRTIINVLSLLQSYPELTFLVSNMAYLRWLSEDRDLWVRVREPLRPVG